MNWREISIAVPQKTSETHPHAAAGPKRLRTNPLIGEGREENEWHAVPLGKQVGLQLDAAHAGHLDICNHTREVIEAVRPQELFGGCECIYDVPERPHKAVSRGAHGCIIVNDCD